MLDLPVTVSEWPKNARETVRVRLDVFHDRATVDVRTWYLDEKTQETCPGRAGITLAVRHLPALAAGIVQALETARAAGLVNEDPQE
ncbi:MAG: transcriptional coactivator p15/PC4 family protein [Parvibaculum sp.]|nr:transcriptional coactivator p15/PC4 family protein [Parvibaculum sp.]